MSGIAGRAAQKHELGAIVSAGQLLHVAEQLTAHDALASHARDELGLDPSDLARPVQAAVTSAFSFCVISELV